MRPAESIKPSLWMKLTVSLTTRFDVTAQTIRRLIPKKSQFVQYGRVYQLKVGMLCMLVSLTHPNLIAVTCHLSGYVLMHMSDTVHYLLRHILVSAFG